MNEMKKLIENAIACGNKKKSSLTDYIHHAYENIPKGEPLPIPVRENFFYVLALFRSKTSENIALAKEMLGKLLHFQGETGNFPSYLHQYPACQNPYLAVDLIPIIAWILGEFSLILGPDLRERTENTYRKLIDYSLQEDSRIPGRNSVRYIIGKHATVAGNRYDNSEWVKQGEKILQEHQQTGEHLLWWECEGLATMLLAGEEHWEHAYKYWHPHLGVFTGLSLLERQEGSEPRLTLLDFIMGLVSGKLSSRSQKEHIAQLQAALIPKTLPPYSPSKFPIEECGQLDNHDWLISFDEKQSCCIIAKPEPLTPGLEPRFVPLRLLWGDPKRLHSFVCQGGHAEKIEFKKDDGNIVLTFTLGEPPESDEKTKNRDICFFIDRQESLSITTKGEVSTTFHLDDTVNIRTKEMAIDLKFDLVDGKGKFMGHIFPGNRPSQVDPSTKSDFQAFDWQIFLRTVQRDGPCKLSVTVSHTMPIL